LKERHLKIHVLLHRVVTAQMILESARGVTYNYDALWSVNPLNWMAN